MNYNGYEGFEKVQVKGTYFKNVILYNPLTNEELFYQIDLEEIKSPFEEYLLEQPINERVRTEWLRKTKKTIEVGDMVKIVKGNKMVGELKKVAEKYDYYVKDTTIAIPYLRFTDKTKCQEANCELYI